MIEASFNRVSDTQRIYRQTLDAMARPGKINALPELTLDPPEGLNRAAAAIALTMLDGETSFCVMPDSRMIIKYLQLNTRAVLRPMDSAEFIIASGDAVLSELGEAQCGDLLSPEKGATLIVMVKNLSSSGQGIQLDLTGPGIKDSSRLIIGGMDQRNLQTIAVLNREYPLGIDVICVDELDNVACMPRSSTLSWEVLS